MPWCPQCRAEYRAGVTTCAVCAVALVEERPPAERRATALPRALARIVADAGAALRYGMSALRLLRRNPSLLILPLAFTAFNAVERGAGSYITLRHTAWGRGLVRELQEVRQVPAAVPISWGRPGPGLRWREDVQSFAHPVPAAQLYGAAQVLDAATRPAGTHVESSLKRGIAIDFVASLAFTALSALLLAGYYGVAAGTVATGTAPWGRFGPQMRRHWVRFFLVGLVLMAVIGGPFYLVAVRPFAPFLVAASNWWYAWITPIVSFFLALALYAVAADDVSVREAIRRSVIITATGLVTGVMLLAALALLEYAFLGPLSAAAEAFAAHHEPTDLAALPLAGIPWELARHLWQAFLGVILCLAMFYWYGEASKRFRAEAAPVPADGPAAPSLEALG